MTISKSTFNLHMAPSNANGERVSLDKESFDTLPTLLKVADKRTRKLAVSLAEGNITLPEALQAAYMQGVHDASISAQTEKKDVHQKNAH